MRQLLTLTLIVLGIVSCKRDGSSKSNQPINDDQSAITTDSTGTDVKNVTYAIESLQKNGENKAYIVRRTNRVHTAWGAMGQESKFTVDVFDIKTRKLIKSFSMAADEITFSRDGYIRSTLIGCCGAENYYQFLRIWTNEPFLQFITKYYYVEIPNSGVSFYFGYMAPHDEKDLTVGELYFVQRVPVKERSKIIDWRFKEANKIIFRAKSKELFDTELPPFCPTMTLNPNTEKDRLTEHEDHQELTLWSFNKSRTLKGITFNSMTLKFGNNEDIIFNIPIENGYLFGDSTNYTRTLYVEK